MDPNENLKQQRLLTRRIIDSTGVDGDTLVHDADRLAELSQALDEWLCGGGFLPEDWQAGPVTVMRKVKGDRPDFKNVTVSMAQYGAYVEVWWHKGSDSPNIECNFFDGSLMGFPKAAVLAKLLDVGAGIARDWFENPPWDRSIA